MTARAPLFGGAAGHLGKWFAVLSPHAADALSIGILAAIGITLVVCIVGHFRRSPLTPVQTVLFDWNMVWARVFWRAEISGRLPLSDDQGAVILLNHRCPFDPSSVYLTTDRVVHWMVAKEYCLHPMMAWFFRTCEAIPVGREGVDTAATRWAIRRARRGELVGMFPEGRINTTERVLLPGRPGAALIALSARVPVVPCYLSGSPFDGTILGSLFMPAKIRLQVGRPIDISEFYGQRRRREVLEELTRRFLCEMARLAGQPDHQPELADRFYKPGPTNG